MTNKTVANLLIGSYGIAAISGIIEFGEIATSLLGIAMIISSIIAVVRLYKLKSPK